MDDEQWTEETCTTHYYSFYGRLLEGYGPSMDPHRCGDPREPCFKIIETRKVTDWSERARIETP